jgi:hypothetical protein
MKTSLTGRLGRLEESQRRPIRERVLRICDRLGATLTAAETEAMVARHAGTPARIRRMHAAGMPVDEITDVLMSGVPE